MNKNLVTAVLLAMLACGGIVAGTLTGLAKAGQPPAHIWAELAFDGEKYEVVNLLDSPPGETVAAAGPTTKILPDRAFQVRSGELYVGSTGSEDGEHAGIQYFYDGSGNWRSITAPAMASNLPFIWPATNGVNGQLLYVSNATTGQLGLTDETVSTLTGDQGDLITFSATDTRAAIAAAALGNALISQGANTEPIWGKISLTDHIEDILGFANGGFGFATASQGDLFYASAADTPAKLVKSAIVGDVLGNSAASNNPQWRPAEIPRMTNITQSDLAGTTTAATALTFAGEGSATLTVTDQNRVGQVYHIIAAGGLTSDADGGESTILAVKIGGGSGITMATSPVVALGVDADAPWRFDLYAFVLTTGATATVYVTGDYYHTVAAGAVHKDIHTHITAGDALDLTATKDIVVVNDFSGTDAGDHVFLDALYCTGNNQDTD